MVPDVMGLRPLFDEHVQRLADDNGWAVVAVELWPGREDLPVDERLGLVSTIDDQELMSEFAEAADLLEVEPVGITGFCMGGMFAMKAAGTGRFSAAVSFYGMIRPPREWVTDRSIEPIEAVMADGACKVLAIIGTEDRWTPEADVVALEASGAEVVRYEGADHGFVHDPSRPAHRPADAADAWRRAIAFLSR